MAVVVLVWRMGAGPSGEGSRELQQRNGCYEGSWEWVGECGWCWITAVRERFDSEEQAMIVGFFFAVFCPPSLLLILKHRTLLRHGWAPLCGHLWLSYVYIACITFLRFPTLRMNLLVQ